MPSSWRQFPLLCEKDFCVFFGEGTFHHRRRIHLVEFLTSICKYCPLHHWKRHWSWKGTASVMLDGVASSSHQSLIAWLYYHLACGRCGFSFENGFHLYGWYVHCLIDSFLDFFHIQDWGNHLVDERSQILLDADLFDVDLILPYLTIVLTNAQVLSTDGANYRVTISWLKPK